jgi:hypothetical protein
MVHCMIEISSVESLGRMDLFYKISMVHCLIEISSVESLVWVDHLLPPAVRVGRQVVYHNLVPSLAGKYFLTGAGSFWQS